MLEKEYYIKITLVSSIKENESSVIENVDNSELPAEPLAESTVVMNGGGEAAAGGDGGEEHEGNDATEQDECTEADRITVQKTSIVRKQSKVIVTLYL